MHIEWNLMKATVKLTIPATVPLQFGMSDTTSIRPATTKLCSLDQPSHSFLAHAVSTER
jgi:hypothetical protein